MSQMLTEASELNRESADPKVAAQEKLYPNAAQGLGVTDHQKREGPSTPVIGKRFTPFPSTVHSSS